MELKRCQRLKKSLWTRVALLHDLFTAAYSLQFTMISMIHTCPPKKAQHLLNYILPCRGLNSLIVTRLRLIYETLLRLIFSSHNKSKIVISQ